MITVVSHVKNGWNMDDTKGINIKILRKGMYWMNQNKMVQPGMEDSKKRRRNWQTCLLIHITVLEKGGGEMV
jgi:hypothetical protein